MDNREFVWWRHGVVYQIYPRSFYDSKGDGSGDLRGIIEKLDYLQWLGIDAVWLSPVNSSPKYDCGYDISDYYSIDPLYGSADDYMELLRECHIRGIRVIMDLVLNHTSHLHSWFVESRSSPDSPKRNWYIWRSGSGKKPPNKWKSAFGGSAWEYDRATGEYYLHSFLREQPDLNWRNREVREAMYSMIRFWLDRGVDGFRLDVVNWMIKDEKFRNNPFSFLPFARGRLRYDRNRPEAHEITRELRTILESYSERMSVGEVFSLPPGDPELSASFLGDGTDELHLAFDFSIMYRLWNARSFYRCFSEWYRNIPDKGWPCNVLSNHDQPRSRNRFMGGADSIKRAKVAAVMLLTLRGTPFMYYGEEIGMKGESLRRRDIHDVLGKRFWPFYTGRESSRRPMPWDSGENAGFSSGRPWIPVNSDYIRLNVESQKQESDSILRFYRSIILLRKEYPALMFGTFEPHTRGLNGIVSWYRRYGPELIFVALNFTPRKRSLRSGKRGQWEVLASTHRSRGELMASVDIKLFPYEATVMGMKKRL